MNNLEFLSRFDVLYNNITSNKAPGLNSYEVSVFLTKGQEEIIKNYFNPLSNRLTQGFDNSEKRQRNFSMIIDHQSLVENSSKPVFDPRSIAFALPENLLFILNEHLIIQDSNNNALKQNIQIVPINYDEYTRLMSKPYKEPFKNQAWRLMTSTTADNSTSFIEIVMTTADKKLLNSNPSNNLEYWMRYVKVPRPIILADFSSEYGQGYTINGYNGSEEPYSNNGTNTTWEPCMLDPSIHEEILQRAVELAKTAWLGTNSDIVEMGNRSE